MCHETRLYGIHLFNSNLDRRITYPNVQPDQGLNLGLWIMTEHFIPLRRFRPHSYQWLCFAAVALTFIALKWIVLNVSAL